ncbi:cytidylyltransferase domain-containing protein [Paenibacillus rhizoplanae]
MRRKSIDYYSALEPEEFRRMVDKLRRAECVQGSLEIKESERSYLEDSSLRIVSRTELSPGQMITPENISYKRSSVPDAFMVRNASVQFPMIATAAIPANTPITPGKVKAPKICIAVICRLKSTRLRRKALREIHGIPAIERCLMNCLAVPGGYEVVLATSDLPDDQPLTAFNLNHKVKVVTGDPDNVAARMLSVAEAVQADIVVRVTGDNPAISPEMLKLLIDRHLASGADFTYAKESTMGTVGGCFFTVEALRRLLHYSNPLTHAEYLSFYFFSTIRISSTSMLWTFLRSGCILSGG